MTADTPRQLTEDELQQLVRLGGEVLGVLLDTGLPTGFQPDPAGPPPVEAGARIRLDQLNPNGVYIEWSTTPELRRRVAAVSPHDLTHRDLKIAVAARSAMSEAIARILSEAGYLTRLGYDMDPSAVWVRRPPN